MSDIVFRIQDKYGRGPWKPGFSRYWVEPRPDHANLIPFYQEFGPVFQYATSGMFLGCGCLSENQLRRWFSPTEYQRLIKLGYQAVRIGAGRILAESDIQCVFERTKPLHKDVSVFDLYDEATK